MEMLWTYLNKFVDYFFPEGSVRRIIIKTINLGLIKNNKMRLIFEQEHQDYLDLVEYTRNLEEHTRNLFEKSYEKSIDYVPFGKTDFMLYENDPKLIAFYLPQFHPIPENDQFFGKSFTEWTNTTRAVPLFKGHYQPRLPDELGFYDTRFKHVLKRQIEIAKEYGIYGFCFHHYWFSGKPVLRVPYNHILSNPDLDIPFCLNWANESWTVRWDGFDSEDGILLRQDHSADDDIAFIKDIEPALRDRRYIRINGRPLLLIYRPGRFSDMRATVDRWNDYLTNRGVGQLFLAEMQTNFENILNPTTNIVEGIDPQKYSFDAAVEYPPHGYILLNVKNSMELFYNHFSGEILKYEDIIDKSLQRKTTSYPLFRGIFPGWDCTPRRKNPIIYINSTPEIYKNWLDGIIAYTKKNLPSDKQFIFINSWNEWAEGAYLEPDRRYGFAYLNATRRSLLDARKD